MLGSMRAPRNIQKYSMRGAEDISFSIRAMIM